jgi:hypothetical protein
MRDGDFEKYIGEMQIQTILKRVSCCNSITFAGFASRANFMDMYSFAFDKITKGEK